MPRILYMVRWAAIAVAWAVLIAAAVFTLAYKTHAQTGPTVIIAPNGAVTYVYPGPPAVVIAPNGSVSTIYPTTPVTPAPVYTPPPVAPR